jgi:hypothetical protein
MYRLAPLMTRLSRRYIPPAMTHCL